LSSGAIHEACVAALQITPKYIHAAGLNASAGVLDIAQHAIVNQPFSQLHDVDVQMVQLPELALRKPSLGFAP